MEMVKVAVDVMGGDHAPLEIVKGAIGAVNENKNIKVYLVGKETASIRFWRDYPFKKNKLKYFMRRK